MYYSALNSPQIAQSMASCFAQTLQNTLNYTASAEHANRSTEKTHILHRGVYQSLYTGLGDFARPFEEHFLPHIEAKYPGQNKGKRIHHKGKNHDLIIFDRQTEQAAFIFPIKNPQSSILKNIHNYDNATLGELLKTLPQAEKAVISLFFMPDQDIVFQNKGKTVTTHPLKPLPPFSLPGSEHCEIFTAKTREMLHHFAISYSLTLPNPTNHSKATYQNILHQNTPLPIVDTQNMGEIIKPLLLALTQKSPILEKDIKKSHPFL